VVFWELVTGERLFHDTGQGVDRQITSHRIPPPSEVQPELPPGLDAVLMRGLHRSAGERTGSAQELAAALEAVIEPASPAEIGEWLKGLARERLEEQEALAVTIASTPVERRHVVELADWAETGSLSPAPWGDTSTAERPVVTARPGKPLRPVAGAAALAVALMLMFGARAVLRDGETPPARSASASAAQPAPSVATERPAPRPVVVQPTPAMAMPSVVITPLPRAASAPAARPIEPRPMAAAPVPRSPSRARVKPRRHAAVSCNPPYTIDGDGIRRIKRECLGR
jgi:hypothetical protein